MQRKRRGEHARCEAARRATTVTAVLIGALLTLPATAPAIPPPPPKPSEAELRAAKEQAQAKASRVGELTNELAAAEAQLNKLKARVARKLEAAKKAMIDLRRARRAAERAERRAEQAKAEVRAASERIDELRKKLDEFVSNTFQRASMPSSVSAYLGSDSSEELLARAHLLNTIAEGTLNALETMRRAQVAKANKEAAARAALREARQKREAAQRAKQKAEAAKAAAIRAREAMEERIAELEAKKERILHELYEARQKVESLKNQREAYQEWLARKRAEERRRQQAALAGSGGGTSSTASTTATTSTTATASTTSSSLSASALIEKVIARAKSVLGVPYAWGGGNAYGPTEGFGIDAGVVGFDCSGLMTYAFAPVQIIPSYSGYQYDLGRKVPVSQAQRGDMLFWGPGGSQHVALYLGHGMMIEAPYSGGHVRIAPVRWAGIAPYAVRLIG